MAASAETKSSLHLYQKKVLKTSLFQLEDKLIPSVDGVIICCNSFFLANEIIDNIIEP